MYPDPRDLPESRLKSGFAFENVGIDYAGLVFVNIVYSGNNEFLNHASNQLRNVFGFSNGLFWIFVYKFSTKIFQQMRYELLISDNVSTFISSDVQEFVSNHNLTWKFNLQAAPWLDERICLLLSVWFKSVKRCLKRYWKIQGFLMNIPLLVEVERIVNNRPLTYIIINLFKVD